MNISSLIQSSEAQTMGSVRDGYERLSEFCTLMKNALEMHRGKHAAKHSAMITDHLLKDIGLTRWGISEEVLADRVEISS